MSLSGDEKEESASKDQTEDDESEGWEDYCDENGDVDLSKL